MHLEDSVKLFFFISLISQSPIFFIALATGFKAEYVCIPNFTLEFSEPEGEKCRLSFALGFEPEAVE